MIKKTYGKAQKLKEVTIIVTEENSDGDVEVTVVPNKWVIEIR